MKTMDLLLLRHAKSDHDSSQWQTDAERPLSAKGIRRQKRCALGMKQLPIKIDQVWVSTYIRAKQTFKIIQEVLNLQIPVQFREDLIVFADPKHVFSSILDEFEKDESKTLLLVGHNPNISTLYQLFIPDQDQYLRTSELVWIKIYSKTESKLVDIFSREKLYKLAEKEGENFS